jgi:hypothetical protein
MVMKKHKRVKGTHKAKKSTKKSPKKKSIH